MQQVYRPRRPKQSLD